jgi:hypothetical protein
MADESAKPSPRKRKKKSEEERIFATGSRAVAQWALLVLLTQVLGLCFIGLIESFTPRFDRECWKEYLASRQSRHKFPNPESEHNGSQNVGPY